jgi:hypothetical protein
MVNEFYTKECLRLESMLLTAGIPYEARDIYDGRQVIYPSIREWKSDVVCHGGSYGHEHGLLEQMYLVEDEDDSVEGHLTAEVVFKRWQADYESTK